MSGVVPGGPKEQSISQEQLRLASDLFKEIVKNGELPPTFTPLNVDEIGLDGHKSVVRAILANFGRHGNFLSECNATYLPAVDRQRISSRHKKVLAFYWRTDIGGAEGMKKHYPLKMERMNIGPVNYNVRLHALVMAHTPEWTNGDVAPIWDEDSQAVYYFMADKLGPTLRFNYDAPSNETPGDYSLLVAWAFKNVEKIKQIYLTKDDPANLDTQLARGIGVRLNGEGFSNINNALQVTNTFNTAAETRSIDKIGLTKAELAVAPPTSIVWDFEKLFVRPDQHGGIAGFGDGLEPDFIQALGEEGVQRFCQRLNFLSLLNLAVLSDIPGKSEPIKKLDSHLNLGGRLPEILREYVALVKQAQLGESAKLLEARRGEPSSVDMLGAMAQNQQIDAKVRSDLNSMRPEWEGRSLRDVLKDILSLMSKSEHIGLGSGRALLVQYNEEARTKGINEERLIHTMGMMVKIAKGEGNFGLYSYFDELK